jgi:hypothetical protein
MAAMKTKMLIAADMLDMAIDLDNHKLYMGESDVYLFTIEGGNVCVVNKCTKSVWNNFMTVCSGVPGSSGSSFNSFFVSGFRLSPAARQCMP